MSGAAFPVRFSKMTGQNILHAGNLIRTTGKSLAGGQISKEEFEEAMELLKKSGKGKHIRTTPKNYCNGGQ